MHRTRADLRRTRSEVSPRVETSDSDSGSERSNSSRDSRIRRASSNDSGSDNDEARSSPQHRTHHHPQPQPQHKVSRKGSSQSVKERRQKSYGSHHPHPHRPHRHHRRRESLTYVYGDGQSPWSPWSRWRLVLKLVYAVVVPAMIVYLLGRFDQTLQERRQSLDMGGASRPPQPQVSHSPSLSATTITATAQPINTAKAPTSTTTTRKAAIAEVTSKGEQQQHPGESRRNMRPWLPGKGAWSLEGRPQGQQEEGRLEDEKSSPAWWSRWSWSRAWFERFRMFRPHSHSTSPTLAMMQHVAYGSFLLFGDSITQYSFDVAERGFGAQLAHVFQRRLDVINRGFSGYTTEQAIHLLPQFLPRCSQPQPPQSSNHSQQQQHHHQQEHDQEQEQEQEQEESQSSLLRKSSKIEFLALFFGANDACLSPSPQHVDMDRYEQNLRAMIDMVHHPASRTYSPETRIIVVCPPPVDEIRWAIRRQERGMAMDRDPEVTRQYAETCLKVAREYQEKWSRTRRNEQEAEGVASSSCSQHGQVDVIDTWTIMMDQVKAGTHTLGEYLKDGLHLASKGNDVIFEEIMKIIRSRYPEWDPDTMPMHAPWWGNLDRKHPETDLLICGNKRKH
ncbi:unnamed protein product [Mortierella alpina]